MDADGLTFACATTAEERVARRSGLRAVRVGLGVRERLPEGRLVSFGIAAGSHRAADGTVIDAVRVVDERAGALGGRAARRRRRRTGTILGAVADRRRALRAARACTRATGADAVDMESGAARAQRAARGLPARRSATRPTRPLGGLGRRCDAGRPHDRPRACVRAARPRASRDARGAAARRAPGAGAARGGGRVSKPVLLAAPRSFCAGVDRAIEIVERLLEQHGPPVYVRHHIVHNEHVVRRLERLGAVFVESRGRDPRRRDLRALRARRRAGREARTASSAGCASSTPSARSSRRCTPRRGATRTAATSSRSSATPTTSR